jgi:transcription elongation factor GreA
MYYIAPPTKPYRQILDIRKISAFVFLARFNWWSNMRLSPKLLYFKECFIMGKQMSRSNYEKLILELDDLKINKRKEVAERLKVARSYGDLSENAEYDEAKNEQAILEAQIAELQYTVDNAEIIEDSNISVDEIGMGSIIKIKRVGSDKVETFNIVGTNNVDIKNGKISDESPIGKAAMKKKVGDIFIVEAPVGELRFEVIEISK